MKNTNKIKVITHDNIQDSIFLKLLFNCKNYENRNDLPLVDGALEIEHYKQWNKERDRYINEIFSNIEYKKQTLINSYNKRISVIEQSLQNVYDEKIIRMKTSEINNCKIAKESKIAQLDEAKKMVDIISTRLIQGILKVEN